MVDNSKRRNNMQDKNIIYVFKSNNLYGKIDNGDYYLLKDEFILANEQKDEILDIIPEGIDLKLMLKTFNTNQKTDILPFLINPIGDFSFGFSENPPLQKHISSDLKCDFTYPNILDSSIDIPSITLNPDENTDIHRNKIQRLSLSGYQHKLQVSIINNTIKEDYADFILKPAGEISLLAINEHLHMNFMRELGFKMPFNAIVYDDRIKEYHYLIKRFDIDKNGHKIPQISLNALMKSKDKYEGTIDRISHFLKDKISQQEQKLFMKFIYANALIFNNDLHKKNISFTYTDNTFTLTPIYDIINIYPIKRFSNDQCCLEINGKLNKITIKDFDNIAKIFEINKSESESMLNEILDTYIKQYPKYIESLQNIPNISGLKEFKYKLYEGFENNLRTIKNQQAKENANSIQNNIKTTQNTIRTKSKKSGRGR